MTGDRTGRGEGVACLASVICEMLPPLCGGESDLANRDGLVGPVVGDLPRPILSRLSRGQHKTSSAEREGTYNADRSEYYISERGCGIILRGLVVALAFLGQSWLVRRRRKGGMMKRWRTHSNEAVLIDLGLHSPPLEAEGGVAGTKKAGLHLVDVENRVLSPALERLVKDSLRGVVGCEVGLDLGELVLPERRVDTSPPERSQVLVYPGVVEVGGGVALEGGGREGRWVEVEGVSDEAEDGVLGIRARGLVDRGLRPGEVMPDGSFGKGAGRWRG